ncbi:MAG: ergothioneine biosynthesis protein EgtB [Acidobacteriota bacterium]
MASSRPLAELYRSIRLATEEICRPLATEDYVVQTMPDVSPTKWHLAHTTWFFETFVLAHAAPAGRFSDERYAHLFNSYYQSVGEPFARPVRGHLSRPTVAEVYAYRRRVDEAMEGLLREGPIAAELGFTVELGINHEEQHQELILTDVKNVLGTNPLEPAYAPSGSVPGEGAGALGWHRFDRGVRAIGAGDGGFAFDNERPRHDVYAHAFEIAHRLTTCGEYLAFIEDGGYERPELWLSDGWDLRRRESWEGPMYWRFGSDGRTGGGRAPALDADGDDRSGSRAPSQRIMTLGGARVIDPSEPVCHVSYYEADAFARWAGARLPTEQEWEIAAADAPVRGNLLETRRFHPIPFAGVGSAVAQVYGDVWEWMSSPYVPYPGYRPFPGSLGEYNGKFMINQMVLRGGSCVTPARHIRPTYRNFFPPSARWQFSGIRLAR